MKWYWFSFSFMGVNQGCCNVEAVSQEAALQKTIELNIHPRHDDIDCYEGSEPDLEPNRLFSKEEMIKMNYENYRYTKKVLGEERGNGEH